MKWTVELGDGSTATLSPKTGWKAKSAKWQRRLDAFGLGQRYDYSPDVYGDAAEAVADQYNGKVTSAPKRKKNKKLARNGPHVTPPIN